MIPVLWQIGPVTIYSYGVMLAVAAVVCGWLFGRDASRRLGIEREAAVDLVFWTLLGGIAGARVFYIILNWSFFAQDPLEMIMLQHGGLAFQGGLIGGALTGAWIIYRRRWPAWKVLDMAAPYLALGHGIGRIGCFLNGCCYGRPVPWGVYFPVHHDHLHPTQLYAAAALVVICLVLKIYQRRRPPVGRVFAAYCVLAGVKRFIIEFFRADHMALWGGLSVFQYVAFGIIAVGAVLWHIHRRHERV